jgi:CDP-glucose 4,6-dehydratase
VRAVVCVTTDKCYQNLESDHPYCETDPLGGHDPYSSSKACAEIVSAAYRDSFFPVGRLAEHHVILATARAGNVIGGGDWSEDRLIPDLIRSFQAGQPALIRRPNAIRPWQHVLEPLNGYILLAEQALAERELTASSFNFGPIECDAWPVERIAAKLASMWGDGASWTKDSTPSVQEAHYLTLNSTKAHTQLGWQPRLSIETALEWTMNWYRSWQEGADMARECQNQIARFERLAAQ